MTPDSFSDGGRFNRFDRALHHAEQMLEEGAWIIDIGGESTRPGAEPVSEQQELDRVLPLLQALKSRLDVRLSVDTSKPAVMREAVACGVDMINDVCALQADGAIQELAGSDVAVCLMHMQGEPRTMQQNPQYDDVVQDLSAFFIQRIAACEAGGIDRQHLLLDPGFGFGKTLQHNLRLLARLSEFQSLGLPLLVGISRKSMIGQVLGDAPVEQRLHGSVAAALLAVERGASVVRVHDVRATVDALKMLAALQQQMD